MKKRSQIAALALLIAVGVAACNGDVDPEAPPGQPGAMDPGQMGQEMNPETMALMMEAQEIQQRLAPLEQEAMQDPELAAQLEAVQEQVETAMRDEDPDLFEEMARLEEAFVAAREAGDEGRAQEVGMEAQGIYAQLQSLQQRVMDRPEIREPIEEFEAAHRERMLAIDPEAGELLDRMQEILREFEAGQEAVPQY